MLLLVPEQLELELGLGRVWLVSRVWRMRVGLLVELESRQRVGVRRLREEEMAQVKQHEV